MTTITYASDVIAAPNNNAINLGANVNAYIARDVLVAASTEGYAGIVGPGGSVITVFGDVFGTGYGLYMTGASQNHILIGESGSVAGNSYGLIDNGADSIISNYGTISGGVYGAFLSGNSVDVHNFGTIHGGFIGVLFTQVAGTNLLTNDGVIDALVAVSGSSASEYVDNTGLITGTVTLNGGDDTFDTRDGRTHGTVYLGDGNDTMFGSDRHDDVDGGNNDDVLRGRGDDDQLDGGAGMDKLRGGQGEDSFKFSSTLAATNVDTIVDFAHGDDQILLSSTIFAALGADVSASEFLSTFSGHNAFNNNQHIIYDRSKGTLWYDADGHGGTAAIKFAQLGTSSNHPTNIDFHDFAIV